jgi:UDP-N-acetylmuramoylalanine--D-glutamate ligase
MIPGAHSGRMLVIGLGATGASVLRFCAARNIAFDATDSRAEPADLSELQALDSQARFALGGFAAPGPVSGYAAAVVSPGVSLEEPFVRALRADGLPLIGDIELFAQTAEAPVVAITGSNGKSTTTELLGAMAESAGLRAGVGGNLGTPALDLLDPAAELYVLELSSFQLETTHSLAAAAATVLNLSEDHLDRHGDMARYAAAKARVYRGCGTAVINRDEPLTAEGAEAARRQLRFGAGAPQSEADYGIRDGWLVAGEQALIAIDAMRLRGRHNHLNALAALALAEAASLPRERCLQALRDFDGLPHRCVLVAEGHGVQWLDDSKATNVGAACAALAGMDAPVIWIGGGQGKGQDFAPLAAQLAERARAAIVFGQDAELLAETLRASAVPVQVVGDLEAAVRDAAQTAQSGDCVLLSPACASLDQFSDYRARGQAFARLAREVAA